MCRYIYNITLLASWIKWGCLLYFTQLAQNCHTNIHNFAYLHRVLIYITLIFLFFRLRAAIVLNTAINNISNVALKLPFNICIHKPGCITNLMQNALCIHTYILHHITHFLLLCKHSGHQRKHGLAYMYIKVMQMAYYVKSNYQYVIKIKFVCS